MKVANKKFNILILRIIYQNAFIEKGPVLFATNNFTKKIGIGIRKSVGIYKLHVNIVPKKCLNINNTTINL